MVSAIVRTVSTNLSVIIMILPFFLKNFIITLFILWSVVVLTEVDRLAEIFTLVQLSENKVALKSGYGCYLGVNSSGEVIGKAEAVAAREQWEAIFEEVHTCIC